MLVLWYLYWIWTCDVLLAGSTPHQKDFVCSYLLIPWPCVSICIKSGATSASYSKRCHTLHSYTQLTILQNCRYHTYSFMALLCASYSQPLEFFIILSVPGFSFVAFGTHGFFFCKTPDLFYPNYDEHSKQSESTLTDLTQTSAPRNMDRSTKTNQPTIWAPYST
jgi:hypothetical protein